MAAEVASLERIHVEALSRLAGGVAHDVKNPLNAMALQLALLGDKMAADEGLAGSCAQNLASLKTQIGRVDEVLRRFVAVADPSTDGEWLDLAAYVPDAASLFGHEARRRGIELRCERPAVPLRACCAPAAGGRLVLGLLLEAVLNAPTGSKVLLSAGSFETEARVRVERTAGGGSLEILEAVRAGATLMGGGLDVVEEGAIATRVLRFIGERTT